MLNLFLNIPTKTKILLAVLVTVVIITTVIVALQTPSPSTQKAPPITTQDTIIGKKITPDIEKKLDIIKKEASAEGQLIYSLNSQNPIRTDQIITKNDQIIFERRYIPEDPSDPNHLLISNMLAQYGEPDIIIRGSKLWGHFINTYIYSSKGIAFIGNPNTDEVYELQNFAPTTLDEYLQKYGDDIDNSPQHGES